MEKKWAILTQVAAFRQKKIQIVKALNEKMIFSSVVFLIALPKISAAELHPVEKTGKSPFFRRKNR
jgi:hypothetical protein